MRIDAHIHFWRPANGFDNKPIADNAAYRRDFLPEHVATELAACGIDGVIAVQTCPQVEETAWLLDLAEGDRQILGVTGWVDLNDAVCDFDALLARPKLIGIRAQLRRIADPGFVERPRVLHNLGRALRAGLGVTILAEARHYPHVGRVLDALPAGPITVNHLGLRFPDVDAGAWRGFLRQCAQRADVFVQLSGLPFLFGERWRDPASRTVVDDALALLGPRRLVFASDWPMLVRFASYTDWVRYVERLVEDHRFGTADVDAIFGGNVLRANPRLRIDAKATTVPLPCSS